LHILGGRDLHRAERGTWLGITKQGRLAVLTNFREEHNADESKYAGIKSRGAMVNAYLRTPKANDETSEDVARSLVEIGLSGVGGFSLMFGRLRRPDWKSEEGQKSRNGWKGLCVVSNRSKSVDDVHWLCSGPGETHALSNSLYGDHDWPKVLDGERLLEETIKKSSSDDLAKSEKEETLIQQLLGVLSNDTLPKQTPDQPWNDFLMQLRRSIFIPAIGKDPADYPDRKVPMSEGSSEHPVPVSSVWDPAMSGRYGTQKQTVILVDWNGRVKVCERTLWDGDGKSVPAGEGDSQFEFEVEGWNE
jgi:uncharacterized protein with NRDE domain